MRLYRAHGLGNDYLVLEDGPPLTAALARHICDRHLGVGGDGVLEPRTAPGAELGVRIWNPDGSLAEKSGNGLRILAWWAHRERGLPAAFTVWTGHDVVACQVEGEQVTVEMGVATLVPEQVPVDASAPLLDAPMDVAGETLRVTAVGMGNPHAVIFRDEVDLDALPWRRWGEDLERHPRFPNRTNVQVARVAGPGLLQIRIWERGAGPTLASGSSSCAAAVAAVETGRLAAGPIEVDMPGGRLQVTVGEGRAVRLRGPVEAVGRFEVDPSWLRRRQGG